MTDYNESPTMGKQIEGECMSEEGEPMTFIVDGKKTVIYPIQFGGPVYELREERLSKAIQEGTFLSQMTDELSTAQHDQIQRQAKRIEALEGAINDHKTEAVGVIGDGPSDFEDMDAKLWKVLSND